MDRYAKIIETISRKRLDGFLITDLLNIRYLTSFSGSSAALLIGARGVTFFTDFRYQYECERLLTSEELVIVRDDFLRGVGKHLRARGVRSLGFEYGASYRLFDSLRKSFRLKSLKDLVEDLRVSKDSRELLSIREAVRRAEGAFRETLGWIRPGTRERKVALVLEERLKEAGCRRLPFEIIVASGRNSALPHARASEKKIESGDLVTIDWGAEADGYMADMTRTLLMEGAREPVKREIHETVLRANRRAVAAVGAGIPGEEVDAAARTVIEKAGYGDFFGHGTGHGVGLNVHEKPAVSPRSRDVLAPGAVITVEPGIYIPDIGGVRIEDMVLVEKGRGKCLTSLQRGVG